MASSPSEGEVNGFTSSLLSTKNDSWEFSFCLPASQGCPFFKQWRKSSSVPAFARFKPQYLNEFIMFSFDRWDEASNTHSIILFLEGGITKPLIIQITHHCFKWLIPILIRCLNILCTPTWNDHAISIHVLQIFSHAVNHMAFVGVRS